MKSVADLCTIFGRVALASLFVLGGLNKLLHYSTTLAAMEAVGLPASMALLPLVIALELLGGLLVMGGGARALPPALLLAIFTLVVNVVFHDFWNMEGQLAALERSLFFKNVSIAGGLLLCAATVWSVPRGAARHVAADRSTPAGPTLSGKR